MDTGTKVSGPGKTGPRLINDLLDYDLRYARGTGRNILADAAPRFTGTPLVRKGPKDCRHVLIRKDSQTEAPRSNDEQPGVLTKYVVASCCTDCRHHFQIIVDFTLREDRKAPCRLSDEANPMHHLRLVDLKALKEPASNTYNETYRFECTGACCPVMVEIKISPPRLPLHLLASVIDWPKINARGRKVIAEDPERYRGLEPLSPSQALTNLRQYLLDAKVTPGKRMAKRNKKYVLGFADECDQLFEYLGFLTVQDDGPTEEEPTSYFWQLPIITEDNVNFILDVIIELEILISKRPSNEPKGNTRVNVIPVIATKDIEISLGFYGYPTRSRTVDLSTEEHPYYASLGAVDNFTDDLISWAYDRQCECDPHNKPYYLDCLADLAEGRKSSDLETKVVMAKSAGEYGLKDIEGAYKFFALDRNTKEADDHIIGVYNSRIDSAPRQKDEARDCLRVIAKARNSDKIEAVANDKTMSLNEALEFLGVTNDAASDSIEASAVAMALDADKARVAAALRIIAANRTGDYTLLRAANNIEFGSGGLDVGEAYARLQIQDQNIPDETVLTYYNTLSNDAPAGSKDSYTEALRCIASFRESPYLTAKLEDPNADVQVARSTAKEPVGLNNIGNTCYLNSLLQFYYTINAVREVVMNINTHRMDLDGPGAIEAMERKKVGGRKIKRFEIEKAQKFAYELHDLFKLLRTASTKSVKPTNQLAELTIFSDSVEANFREYRKKSISSPHGPPNIASILHPNAPVYGPEGPPPPVPSRPSPGPAQQDIEMVDRPGEITLDNSDNSSEATLVNVEALSDGGTTKVNNSTPRSDTNGPSSDHTLDHEEDAVMVNADDSFPDLEAIPAAPENPPPVPPRNKSGLSISTENKDISSDVDLWTFGSQQDVTEVIGNVVWRLQCAIKANSIDPKSGEQIDNIRDTFYGENAVFTQKSRTMERKDEAWANLIVFPPQTGSRDIYEALDVVFDEQIVDVENTTTPQYTSITKLPPILQIQIQRTAFDPVKQLPWKNRNPVTFPETLYMDRYMHSEDETFLQRRRIAWGWKTQLRALEARRAALKDDEAEISVADALFATKDFITDLQAAEIEDMNVDPNLLENLEERLAEIAAELESLDERIATLKQKLSEQFTNLTQYEYKLQTVFIHRGEAGSGHYWIYVYDFENDTWREYNDEYVSVVKDRRRIFENQSGGTPYYLAYVRSKDKKELVNAVVREVAEVEMADVPHFQPIEMDAQEAEDEGISMGDARHIEHVKPRPLLPKPLENLSLGGQAWDDQWVADVDANGKKW